MLLKIVVLVLCTVSCYAYLWKSNSYLSKPSNRKDQTALYAHHVNKKITKRMMDRRPKKSRPSDISRSNVNHDKCITKVKDAPSEYTMVSAEDYAKERSNALQFWETGDPEALWIELIAEDELTALCQNINPPPLGTRRKKPPLLRSGTY